MHKASYRSLIAYQRVRTLYRLRPHLNKANFATFCDSLVYGGLLPVLIWTLFLVRRLVVGCFQTFLQNSGAVCLQTLDHPIRTVADHSLQVVVEATNARLGNPQDQFLGRNVKSIVEGEILLSSETIQ